MKKFILLTLTLLAVVFIVPKENQVLAVDQVDAVDVDVGVTADVAGDIFTVQSYPIDFSPDLLSQTPKLVVVEGVIAPPVDLGGVDVGYCTEILLFSVQTASLVKVKDWLPDIDYIEPIIVTLNWNKPMLC